MQLGLRDCALPLLVLALLAAAPFIGFGQGHSMTLLARAMILAMAAVSLSLLVGGAGLISLGHAAMLGFGAYAVVVLDAAGITEAASSQLERAVSWLWSLLPPDEQAARKERAVKPGLKQ